MTEKKHEAAVPAVARAAAPAGAPPPPPPPTPPRQGTGMSSSSGDDASPSTPPPPQVASTTSTNDRTLLSPSTSYLNQITSKYNAITGTTTTESGAAAATSSSVSPLFTPSKTASSGGASHVSGGGTPSKDITDLIQVTNECEYGDADDADDILDSNSGGDDDDDDGGDGRNKKHDPFDCLFGGPSFCPIGTITSKDRSLEDYVTADRVDRDRDSKKDDEDENDMVKSVRKVVDGATQKVRETVDAHVKPKLEDVTQSVRTVVEEHVTPQYHKVRRASMETVETLQQKSSDTLEKAKKQSLRTVDTVKEETRKIATKVQDTSQHTLTEVQTHTKFVITGVQNHTKVIVDTSVQKLEEVSNKVKPKVTEFIDTSRTMVETKRTEYHACCTSFLHDLTVTYRPYYAGTAPGLRNNGNTDSTTPWYWLCEEGTFRAFGKVLFCDNPITGLLIWCGICYSSPFAGCCAMLGVVTVNTTALYLEMDLDKVQNGQYARNAVLIGPSLVDCFGFDFPLNPTRSGWPILLFLTMVLSLVTFLLEALWLQHSLRRFRWRNGATPSLLVPYNLTLLVTLCCAKIWNSTMLTQVVFQNHAYYHEDEERDSQNHSIVQVPQDDGEFMTISTTNIHNYHTNTSFFVFPAVVNSLSRIFFVDGIVTGLLILLGVALCSRIVAGSLIGGALLSSAFVGYAIFDENLQYLNTGYAGYQAALCVAGIFSYFVPSTKLLGLSLIAILWTVLVSGAVDVVLRLLGIPVSTSIGFCLVLLPLLSLDLDTIFGQGHFIRRIPESELSTPEGYLESLRPAASVPLPPEEEDSMIEYDDAMEEEIMSKTTLPASTKVDDEESGFLDAASKLLEEEKEEGEEERRCDAIR
mmetsp:Transcript_6476/g.7274  ORF Transcript_6476/g.7274 Transcript_6476/m.7274 type:complete len:866 (+) Transcript_6476:189-2786(+)